MISDGSLVIKTEKRSLLKGQNALGIGMPGNVAQAYCFIKGLRNGIISSSLMRNNARAGKTSGLDEYLRDR